MKPRGRGIGGLRHPQPRTGSMLKSVVSMIYGIFQEFKLCVSAEIFTLHCRGIALAFAT